MSKKGIFERLRRPDKNRKHPITYIFFALIFGMIIIAFVFMDPGMMGAGGIGGRGTAAKVGSSVVSVADFRNRLEILRQNNAYLLNSGNEQIAEMINRQIQNQALSYVLNVAVLDELKSKEGLIVTDAQVSEYILDIPFLQEEGRFQRSKYENFLANTGRSPKDFEESIRKGLRLDLARQLFESAFKASLVEDELKEQMKDLKIKFDYISIAMSDLQNNIKVSQSEIEEFMNDPKNAEVMKKTYEENGADYLEEEKVKARLILILAEDGQEESMAEAKKKMDEISKGLKPGNFAQVAKKHSEDPTAEDGGDLGYVVKGTYSPQWDSVAFRTAKGKVSEAFKTEMGWAKLLIEDKTPAKKQDYASVKEDVARKTFTQIQAQSLLDDLKKRLAASKAQGLDAFLNEKDLSWQTSATLNLSSQEVPELGEAQKFMDATLSLKKDGDVFSKLVQVNGKSYLIRRNQIVETTEDPKKPQDMNMFEGARMNMAFNKWLGEKKKSLPIEVNPALGIQQESQPNLPF